MAECPSAVETHRQQELNLGDGKEMEATSNDILFVPDRNRKAVKRTMQQAESKTDTYIPIDKGSDKESLSVNKRARLDEYQCDAVPVTNEHQYEIQAATIPDSASDATHAPIDLTSSSPLSVSRFNSMSAYSFEKPDRSLTEFDDSVLYYNHSTLPSNEESPIWQPLNPKSTVQATVQDSSMLESNEMISFKKWLNECVEIIAD